MSMLDLRVCVRPPSNFCNGWVVTSTSERAKLGVCFICTVFLLVLLQLVERALLVTVRGVFAVFYPAEVCFL